MKENIQVRIADIDDLEDCVKLLAQLFAIEKEFTSDTCRQRDGLTLILQNKSIGEILVADNDNVICAMVSLLYSVSTALGAKVAILEDMVVDDVYRNRGIGKILLESAVKHAEKKGCHRITLLTDSDNAIARKMYRSEGFIDSDMVVMRNLLKK